MTCTASLSGLCKGAFLAFWLVAGLIVVRHAGMEYTSFGGSMQYHSLQTRGAAFRRTNPVGLNSISLSPKTSSTYSAGYVSDRIADEGLGRGAVYGGFFAMALGAGLLVCSSLPFIGVGLVSAVSVGLIGRDLQGLMKSRVSLPAVQMFGGVLLLVFGASLLSASNPALLAIASGAAVIGFFLRTQQSLGRFSTRALPSRSSVPDSERRVSPKPTMVWSSWSRVGKGAEWQPGQPGQHTWQSGNWYQRGQRTSYV